jgi:hypothetical protein
MCFMRTAIIGTYPLGDLLGGQDTGRCHHGTFPMDPLGLKGVQPGPFTRPPTRDEAHATPCLFDVAVMRAPPGPHHLAVVPRGIVPPPQPGALFQSRQAITAPGQALEGQRTHGLAWGTSEPELLRRRGGGTQQHARAGQGLGLRSLFGQRFFPHAPPALARRPGVHGRRRQATPPDFIAKAEPPLGMDGSQANQSIALVFFLAYAGSGLVIQGVARFQRVWSLVRAWRIVSPLTRRGVSPAAYATAAAKSRVQTRVGLPKVRGR